MNLIHCCLKIIICFGEGIDNDTGIRRAAGDVVGAVVRIDDRELGEV